MRNAVIACLFALSYSSCSFAQDFGSAEALCQATIVSPVQRQLEVPFGPVQVSLPATIRIPGQRSGDNYHLRSLPAAFGGRAERSEPERSDGERSGARPPKARPRHRACPTKVAQGFAPSSSDARPPFAFFACSAR